MNIEIPASIPLRRHQYDVKDENIKQNKVKLKIF